MNAIIAPSGEKLALVWEPGKVEISRCAPSRNGFLELIIHHVPAAVITTATAERITRQGSAERYRLFSGAAYSKTGA
jgi:hypothetical protein